MNGTIHVLPRSRRRRGRILWPLLLVLVLLALYGIPQLINAVVSYWWFKEVGFTQVFLTGLFASWGLTIAGAVGAFILLKICAIFVVRIARQSDRGDVYHGFVPWLTNAVLIVMSLLSGFSLSSNWQQALFAFHAVSFGKTDPIFHHDISFYVFTLPFLNDLLGWLMLVVFFGLVVSVALLYALDIGGRISNVFESLSGGGVVLGAPQFDVRWLRPYLTVSSLCLSLLALVVAGSNWLMRYGALVSPGDGFQGASYVDIYAEIPAWTILAVLGVAVAVLLVINTMIWRRWAVVGIVGVAWVVAWIVLVLGYPAVVQAVKVNPEQVAAESPQIASNIGFTRAAFGLSSIASHKFNVGTISSADLASARSSVDSLRIEDPDQFLEAALQQQALKTAYDFPSASLDRYQVGGHIQQLIVAPRELNQGQLPTSAQTWQNLNFSYTHGYGLVMSPVNAVSGDGSPQYLIRDIPPRRDPTLPAAAGLPVVTRPAIYFGLDTNTSVFVKTKAQEFDYATDYQTYNSTYGGTAGIQIGGALHRALWALYFGSPIQLGTSSYLSSSSRVLLHRNILDRVNTIAPFLTYDGNPYMVLPPSGHPTWMLDAYTTSSDYPYSEPYKGDTVQGLAGVSYIRNSVKVTIDPYNGTVKFYVADPTDPLIQSIGRVYPGLLQPLDAMPAAIRQHIRYPEDLFSVQTDMLARYHQTSPQSWYNNDDLWAIANDGQGATIPPYYAVTRLPDGTGDEFVVMRSYTPLNKTNMVSIMVGRSDGAAYGQLGVYRFPAGRQVLGPQQLHANIQQKTEFSQDLTLWGQQGSHVHLGSIIVVPVGSGLLYVEPLYLQAESSKIPQLQRVIVYANGKLVWGYSIANALAQIFGNAPAPIAVPLKPAPVRGVGTATVTPIGTPTPLPVTIAPFTGGSRAVLQKVQFYLQAAQIAYGRGDFTTYAKDQAEAYRLLKAALK